VCSPTSKVADRWSETKMSWCSGGAMQPRQKRPAANESRTPRSQSSTWPRSVSAEPSAPPGTHSPASLAPELAGLWIHLDCDAVDDALMPAVDYRLPDGLSWAELETVLRLAIDGGSVVGVEITIFNPTLDPHGTVAQELVACLGRALKRR
jgi:Arginase family